MKKVTCFLPCRAGSERVLRKNIKPFAGHPFGLLQIKIRQLLSSTLISKIVLTTNDLDIITYIKSLGNPRVVLHLRDQALASSSTSTDLLVSHALELINEGHILWTHVTSPFISTSIYDKIIVSYFNHLAQGYDSLMTTTPLKSFLWSNEGPINYDRNIEKWPRSQTLVPVQEINSGAFLAPVDVYKNLGDRIGVKPYLYEMDKISGFDIDWQDDFQVAECLLNNRLVEI